MTSLDSMNVPGTKKVDDLTEAIAASQLFTEELLEWKRLLTMQENGHRFKHPATVDFQAGKVKQAAKNLVAYTGPVFRSVL